MTIHPAGHGLHTVGATALAPLVYDVASQASDAVDRLSGLYTGRGVDAFFVPGGADRAASALRFAENVVLLTGFNVEAGMPETDGPPGTAVLAKALADLGKRVTLVTDATNEPVMYSCYRSLDPSWRNVDLQVFDIERGDRSERMHARHLLTAAHADAVMAVELPGRNAEGIPRNMRGKDIGSFNGPLDAIVIQANASSDVEVTAGVGDGGNEAGMGGLRGIRAALDGSLMRSDVRVKIPVTAWNSNLGAQAVAALMLAKEGRIELLATGEQLTAVTIEALHAGAVDGVTRGSVAGEAGPLAGQVTGVDGFHLAVHAGNLEYLRQVAVQL